MKDVDDLIESAGELADQGLSKGEVADELNVSRETASWLVERSGRTAEADDRPAGSSDIHVDWSTIGASSYRLEAIGGALADLVDSRADPVGLVVGIEKAGVPLATVVAGELETDIATYAPRKHQWEEGDIADGSGTFSRNFAAVDGRECCIVDDTVTSGTTMTETVAAVREAGGYPIACIVLADKQGIDEIEGVPVHSLVQVIQVAGE